MAKTQEIEVRIREIEKGEQGLTLFNFRDELVNFMYKKTVADSTRLSMRFYILIFFLSVQIDSKSLLSKLLDENVGKLKKLNKEFSGREKLKKNEYAKIVKDADLTEVFKNDIVFLLITSILESEKILDKYADYFKKQKALKKEFERINTEYHDDLEDFSENFRRHFIADDRVDDFGNYHDLSKSVYRTIQMRTSRQLDLTLHKYADLKEVKSKSPVDLTILQHIDPRMVVDLWNTYGLGDYAREVWNISADFGLQPYLSAKGIGFIAGKWLSWKAINGRKQHKEKLKAKADFETALKGSKETKDLIGLAKILAQSVLKSNEYLQKEIRDLKEQLAKLSENRSVLNKKEMDKRIGELKKKIDRLENIEVRAVAKKPKTRR